MSLTLHFHPLSSFCQKALVALYETETPFEGHLLDLADDEVRARFASLWPIAKMPVLRDHARDRTIPEATIIVEYLALHHPGRTELVPRDPELAWQTRLRDRFYDLYVQLPMQKIVADRRRPPDAKDPAGVAEARALLATAYGFVEKEAAERTWAMGDAFTMADCAAAPALYYADLVMPLDAAHPNAAAYLRRLRSRPSFARAVEEAAPYRHLFPSA